MPKILYALQSTIISMTAVSRGDLSMFIFKIFFVFIITSRIKVSGENHNLVLRELDSHTKPLGKSDVIAHGDIKSGLLSRKKRSNVRKCPVSCGTKRSHVCHCDDLCHSFNDCCFETFETVKPRTINMSSYIQAFLCDWPLPSFAKNPYKKPFGVILVRNCSSTFQFTLIAEKCSKTDSLSNPLYFLPVTSAYGVTFANIFCALCNDVEKVIPWDLENHIHPSLIRNANKNLSMVVQMFVNRPSTLVTIPPTAVRPRICIRTLYSKQDIGLCSKYQEPVIYDRQVYRNHHCIDKSSYQDCIPTRYNSHCHIQCIEDETGDISPDVFGNQRSQVIGLSLAIHMVYAIKKCKSGELLQKTEVKCVRLGCLDGADLAVKKNCKSYEIYYKNYKTGVILLLKNRASGNKIELLRRYYTILLYVLYTNKFVILFRHATLTTHKNSACTYQQMGILLSYNGKVDLSESAKLDTWLSSLQISYLEIYAAGNQSHLIERLFENKVNQSDASFQEHCSDMTDVDNSKSPLRLPEDKDMIFHSLAKYHTPFLTTCSHIHLTLLVTDKADDNGGKYKHYEMKEFYCLNGRSAVTENIWLLLMCLLLTICRQTFRI